MTLFMDLKDTGIPSPARVVLVRLKPGLTPAMTRMRRNYKQRIGVRIAGLSIRTMLIVFMKRCACDTESPKNAMRMRRPFVSGFYTGRL